MKNVLLCSLLAVCCFAWNTPAQAHTHTYEDSVVNCIVGSLSKRGPQFAIDFSAAPADCIDEFMFIKDIESNDPYTSRATMQVRGAYPTHPYFARERAKYKARGDCRIMAGGGHVANPTHTLHSQFCVQHFREFVRNNPRAAQRLIPKWNTNGVYLH